MPLIVTNTFKVFACAIAKSKLANSDSVSPLITLNNFSSFSHNNNMERVPRIELGCIAWQAIRLPLHHTRT